MSYDVWLEVDAGGAEPLSPFDSLNYTYNLGKFFVAAFGDEKGLYSLDRMDAYEAASRIHRAFRYVHEEAYSLPSDPENKWGSNIGAVAFLGALLEQCAKAPNAKVRVT